jgi:hypothetical protein
VLLLKSATTTPPVGAAADSVTVPADEVPPITEMGFTETVLSDPVTVKAAVCVAP